MHQTTYYVGIYHDQNGELILDPKSIDQTLYKAVNQFYNDMKEQGIVDGAYAQSDSGEQLDDLNDRECDILKLNSNDLAAFKGA